MELVKVLASVVFYGLIAGVGVIAWCCACVLVCAKVCDALGWHGQGLHGDYNDPEYGGP